MFILLIVLSLDVFVRGILEYGIFCFIFSVVMVNVIGVVSYFYGYIKIEVFDIEVVIDQGIFRVVGQGKDIIVSSFKSIDLDEVNSNLSDF